MYLRRFAALVIFCALASVTPSGQEAASLSAVRAGNLAAVHAQATRNPTLLVAKDEAGRSALHAAAAAGRVAVAQYLLARGVAVGARDAMQATPLHVAARAGHLPVATLLVQHKAPLEARDAAGETPLASASARGRTEVVALLLGAGASVDAPNNFARTPLLLAARESGCVDTAGLLLDHRANVDATDRFGDSALTLAAWRGFRPFVDLLLERGARLPEEGHARQRLVTEAASRGLERLFLLLTEAPGAVWASKPGSRSLMHEAAAGGSLKSLIRVMKSALDPNQQDENGWTPLHDAVYMGRAESVRLLIERGHADPNLRNRLGQSPWNLAVEHGRTDVADLLASLGVDRGAPRFPALSGPYLGQVPPGVSPEPFAPGIVGGHFQLHGSVAFSPDGTEAYWSELLPPLTPGYGTARTLVSRRVGSRWTYPQVAMAGGRRIEDVPLVSTDGRRLYDMARRPLPGESASSEEHIWVAERFGEGWGEPRPLDPMVNVRPQHWQFAVDTQGGVYFGTAWQGTRGIFFSRPLRNGYQEPIALSAAINTTGTEAMPFVARDGSYLLFSRNYDIWVSFRGLDGQWQRALPLPPSINTGEMEICPSVSPDGRYLFFLRSRQLWVDAGVIEELRAKSQSGRGAAATRRP